MKGNDLSHSRREKISLTTSTLVNDTLHYLNQKISALKYILLWPHHSTFYAGARTKCFKLFRYLGRQLPAQRLNDNAKQNNQNDHLESIKHLNHLVGDNTHAKSGFGFSKRACKIGITKAPVFPVPVCASPTKSFPTKNKTKKKCYKQ